MESLILKFTDKIRINNSNKDFIIYRYCKNGRIQYSLTNDLKQYYNGNYPNFRLIKLIKKTL